MKTISFNKVWLTGNEKNYITQALSEGKTCGNGNFTHKCQSFFEEKLGSCKCLLTTSCTDALEMCAMLAGIQPGDEVIVPSYTFVSTALAFVRQEPGLFLPIAVWITPVLTSRSWKPW